MCYSPKNSFAGRQRRASPRARLLIGGAFFLGLITPACAGDADTSGLKDPLPESLTWGGVTVYGTIDVGYAYQSHGVPLSGSFYPGLEYNLNGSRNAGRAISTLGENGMEQSKAGIKIAEDIGFGWLAVGKLETAFNPVSGELANECASMIGNNGRLYAYQSANSDGSRCGQAFNGPAFGGVSNAAYGTLTFGRQESLEYGAIGVYDPLGLSPAFSLPGYSGGTAAGIGSTETARWDNSVKYIFQYGPAHAAAMYTPGGEGTAIFNGAYGLNAGGSWQGFSIDANYTKEWGTVVSTSIPNPAYTTGFSCVPGSCPDGLAGTISDNEAWSVMGKYSFDFGGGLKDQIPAGKFTVFAGYVHIDMGNPRDANIPVGSTTIGGYELASVTTNAYTTDKILQTVFTGARYELPSGWSFTGAYYNYTQGAYINNKGKNCATAATAPVGDPTPPNCAGWLNQGSFVADYAFNRRLDVYAGITAIANGGGLNSAYLNDTMTTVVTGLRLKF